MTDSTSLQTRRAELVRQFTPPLPQPCCERERKWARVADIPDYMISNLGDVRRETPGKGTGAGRIIKPVLRPDGHLFVYMPPGNGERLRNTTRPRPKKCFIAVQRLVAAAWLPPVPEEMWKDRHAIIHHKDWNKAHNCDTNLTWRTRSKHLKEHKAMLRRERDADDIDRRDAEVRDPRPPDPMDGNPWE